MALNVGDTIIIIGYQRISQEYFDKHYPQGKFGKVIGLEQRYNSFTGKKLPLKIQVRVYRHKKKEHSITTEKFIKKITVK